MQNPSIQIVSYQKRFQPEFIALNRNWIETYFELEPMDLMQLEDAEEVILSRGGEIFFVLEDDRVVGTCAMVPHGQNEYELAKMAVQSDARGKGFGDLLMIHAIEWARSKRAHAILILSNTVLKPAISLYLKHGAQIVHQGSHPDYKRCNIELKILLPANI
jgi:GNAT superfamily N-acetyltransferase